MKKLCLFCHYDKDELYSEDDIKYVSGLSSTFEKVIVLTGNDKEIEGQKFHNVEYVLQIPNRGLDFGKVQNFLENNSVKEYGEFYICNNSCLLVRDLSPSLKYMREKKLDFWGYTTSKELQLHVQSYFYFLNKKALKEFKDLLFKVNPFNKNLAYDQVIRQIEIKMLSYFDSKGLKCGAYVHCHKLKTNRQDNISYFYPDWLLLNPNYPFIKKKALKLGLHERKYLESFL